MTDRAEKTDGAMIVVNHKPATPNARADGWEGKTWNHVWIVEMWWQPGSKEKGFWSPTVGVGLDRKIGRVKLRRWKERNPDDRFRLALYLRVESRAAKP